MSERPFDDEIARALRRAWFDFQDLVEPIRPDLHRYCLRLTGQVWSAEDLCQETLLRGFGAIGRGDLHGEPAKLRNPRAYLFRVATNLWIDQTRRQGLEATLDAPETPAPPDAETLAQLRDAGAALFRSAAPQERAAVVLKDAFDFSLEEIADLLSTTPGAVKSALHRGRERLGAAAAPSVSRRSDPPSAELVGRFVAAFNNRDVVALRDVLLENVTVEVLGVGGGRTRSGEWADRSIEHATPRAEAREYLGEWIVLHLTRGGRLVGVTRIEETDGAVGRVRSYGFCLDTTAAVAGDLGLEWVRGTYHQSPETLERMIATTGLPWIEHPGASAEGSAS
jgi:RNA polymerase sigma-70 factor (ECF subfamily)